MKLKSLLFIGLWIGDIFLVIYLIAKMSIKVFSLFAVGYMISLIIIGIFWGLLGHLDNKKWEQALEKNYYKVNWVRVGGVLGILLVALGYLAFLNTFISKWIPVIIGFLTGFFVVTYMIFYTQDILGYLDSLVNNLSNIIKVKLDDKFNRNR